MKKLFLIGAAGSLGALARTLISLWMPAEGGFPGGTLAVNVAGAFILCFLVERALQFKLVSETVFDAITAGFLGSFTTFSTFSFETLSLLRTSPLLGISYAAVSLLAGLAAGGLGLYLGGRRRTA